MKRKIIFGVRDADILSGEEGASILELTLVLPALLLLLVGAVDFGRAYFVAIETSSAAEAGALYGMQYPKDSAGIVAASKLDAADIPGLVAVATLGNSCSDGVNGVADCPINLVNYVQVDTTATYTPILPYPGLPSVFTFHGKVRMRAAY